MVTQIYDYLKTIELHTLNECELCPNKAVFENIFKFGKTRISFYNFFLNYETMITHLLQTWKIQNKVTYINCIFKTLLHMVSCKQKLNDNHG